MALTNEAEIIATALGNLLSVALVTRGWPTDQAALPCVAVALASGTPDDYRDDAEYLTELVYYVRIFCATPPECDAVAADVHAVMTGLGYMKDFASEDFGGDVCQLSTRYKKIG